MYKLSQVVACLHGWEQHQDRLKTEVELVVKDKLKGETKRKNFFQEKQQ